MSSKRGRGRGGSRSVSKELLKRSAAEAGLDSTHLKDIDDIVTPPLYPDFQWKSTGGYWDETSNSKTNNDKKKDPSGGVVFCINQQRKLVEEFQARYHFPNTTIVDVARISDQPHLPPDQMVLSQLSKQPNRKLDTRYIPDELLQSNVRANSQGSYIQNVQDEDSESDKDEEEELGGEDYTTNYYASDKDTEDEGEATF